MKNREQAMPEDAEAQFKQGLRVDSLTDPAGAREAVKWFKKAASAGHVDALLNLGCRFRDGRGVRRNVGMASHYFEAAARKGSREGMACLGRLLLATGRSKSEFRRGLALLQKAHSLGEWSAAHFLGRAAEDTGDWREADRWFRRALENGDLTSGLRLARHYLDHLNERFHPIGIAVLKRAIQRSEIDPSWGYTALAKCYLEGRGTRRSQRLGLKYLKMAAEGDREARHLLKELRRSRRIR